MERRSKAGSKLTKTRRRRPVTLNRRDEEKATRRANSSVAVLEEKLKLQARELNEAREQQTDVGFWGRSGNLALDQSTTGFDPNRSLVGPKSRSAASP
jgi:hypothetical protein